MLPNWTFLNFGTFPPPTGAPVVKSKVLTPAATAGATLVLRGCDLENIGKPQPAAKSAPNLGDF